MGATGRFDALPRSALMYHNGWQPDTDQEN
jgi:hypothetical protein